MYGWCVAIQMALAGRSQDDKLPQWARYAKRLDEERGRETE